MKTQNQTPPSSPATRKPYSKPKLTSFGAVRVLTQTSTTGSSEGSGGSGVMKPGCDRRLKHTIREVGKHPWGFNLYLFEYKPEFQQKHGAGLQFGVMADEVAGIVPEAVSTGDDGFSRVDLARLGITSNMH
jgi:hypothetical protein